MQRKLLFSFLLALFAPILLVWPAAAPLHNQHSKSEVLSYRSSAHPNGSKQNGKSLAQASPVLSAMTGVTLPPAHPGLVLSSNRQLQKLASYETAAGGAIASGMMYFTDYPDSASAARSSAANMYSTLKEFSKFGLTPLIIMEPTNSSGVLNFSMYRSGAYDNILDSYFQTLKSLGINDSEIGVWTYFPEANLPEWGPVDVADFAPNVVRSVNIQKKYFPGSRATIMLDAESYPAGSTSWSGGSYSSLNPFIEGIPAGLLDSFGLQGFPWAPPANRPDQAPSYSPAVYLNASLASAAANRLGVKEVWLNTGTFATMYTKNPEQTVRLTANQRQAMLNGVLTQALNLKSRGFKAVVNLFCEDKSNTSMALDRSYKTAEDQAVLNNFAKQLYANGITMWLFDA